MSPAVRTATIYDIVLYENVERIQAISFRQFVLTSDVDVLTVTGSNYDGDR